MTETVFEDAQTPGFLDKNLKTTVLNKLKELKENMGKELKKTKETTHDQNETVINKQSGVVKRNHTEILELTIILK